MKKKDNKTVIVDLSNSNNDTYDKDSLTDISKLTIDDTYKIRQKKKHPFIFLIIGVILAASAIGFMVLKKTEVKLDKYYVTGCEDSLPVRSKQDKTGKILAKLSNNESVYVVSKTGDSVWKVYLEDKNINGYVDCHYLTKKLKAVTNPETKYVDIKQGSHINLLDGPSDNSRIINTLHRADKVRVLAKYSSDYYYVWSDSTESYGYVDNSDLSYDRPIDVIITEPPPDDNPPAKKTDESCGYGEAPLEWEGIYYVHVQKGYLALRNAKAFDNKNEIGKMYNGDWVYAINTQGTYWYVYSPGLGMYGYANGDYLTVQEVKDVPANTYYAHVDSGYLALRNAKAFDSKNEIGRIQNGQEVQVLDKSTGQYWYVYVPALNKEGYVNSDYLIR